MLFVFRSALSFLACFEIIDSLKYDSFRLLNEIHRTKWWNAMPLWSPEKSQVLSYMEREDSWTAKPLLVFEPKQNYKSMENKRCSYLVVAVWHGPLTDKHWPFPNYDYTDVNYPFGIHGYIGAESLLPRCLRPILKRQKAQPRCSTTRPTGSYVILRQELFK